MYIENTIDSSQFRKQAISEWLHTVSCHDALERNVCALLYYVCQL